MRDLRCGNRCRRRTQGCTILKVTEQHRLMARHLPDKLELGPCRNPGDLSVAPRHVPPFIAVKENKLRVISNLALASPLGKPFYGEFNYRERIASARLQKDRVKMHRKRGLLDKAAKQCDIAALAFTLAADEDRHALGPEGTTPSHPICGTAP